MSTQGSTPGGAPGDARGSARGSAKIRVLVVDDSPLFIDALTWALDDDGGLEVVGSAADGADAVTQAKRLRPQLIVMDVTMPRVDGLTAVERIMSSAACPILLVTGDAARASSLTFEALSRGALDVRPKPNLVDAAPKRAFIEHLKLLASVPTVHHAKFGLQQSAPPPAPAAAAPAAAAVSAPPPSTPARAATPSPAPAPRVTSGFGDAVVGAGAGAGSGVAIIGIAASTGGPGALVSLLGALPARFSCPLLVVQHLEPGFAVSFVDWLASASGRRVRLVNPASTLAAGEVFVAPHGAHLVVEQAPALPGGLALALDRRRGPIEGHMPSATALFESMAALGARAAGVVLTGMGRDGADGLRSMKARGALCIVEDGAIVDGMPRAARELGAASRVLPLPEIASALVSAAAPTTTTWPPGGTRGY